MCMILNATNIANGIVLDCSEYKGDFLGSKVLKITDNHNNVFSTTEFIVEKSRSCFGKGGFPWVMVKTSIPENFIKKGNSIEFAN